MSYQGNLMIEQEMYDALEYMGEAAWRELYKEDEKDDK